MFVKNLLIFFIFLNLNQLIISSVIKNNQSDTIGFGQKVVVKYYDTSVIEFYGNKFSDSKYGGFQLRCDPFTSPDFSCSRYEAKKASCRNENYRIKNYPIWHCTLNNLNRKVLLDTFKITCDETDFPYEEGLYYKNTCKLVYNLKLNPDPGSNDDDDDTNKNTGIIGIVVVIVIFTLIIFAFVGFASRTGSRFPIFIAFTSCASSSNTTRVGFSNTSMRSGGGGGFSVSSGLSGTTYR